MIEFYLRGVLVRELPKNTAEAVMRILRKNKIGFSAVGNTVNLRTKEGMHVVLSF